MRIETLHVTRVRRRSETLKLFKDDRIGAGWAGEGVEVGAGLTMRPERVSGNWGQERDTSSRDEVEVGALTSSPVL